MEGGATYWWRPRTDNRDRKYLLRTINRPGSKHWYDTRHCAGTANTWAMVVTFSRAWRCKRSSIRSCRIYFKPRLKQRRIWTRLSKPKSVYPKSVNGENEITQHAISFTLFGTQVIFETPHYDYSVTGQTGPHMRYCLWAPDCDATPLVSTTRCGLIHHFTVPKCACSREVTGWPT